MSRNPDPEEVFTQKLTGRQRVHLRSPASFVVMVARIQGDVSHEALKQAVHHMQQRHAMLGVRVVADENGDPWFTSDDVEEIPIAQAPRSSETHWRRVCMDEFRIPFEIDRRPLIRFILLHSPDESDVVMLCQHSICDGLSLAYLTHDILEYLGDPGQEVETLPPPPVLEESIPSRFRQNRLIGLLGKAIFSRYNRRWARAGVTFDNEDAQNLHSAFWNHHKLRVRTCAIEGTALSMLVAACRDKGVTVNAILITAFHAALFENRLAANAEFFEKVNVAMSLRRDLSPSAEGSFGLFASGADCELRYDPEESLWENAARFQPLIQRETDLKKSYRKIALLSHMQPGLFEALPFASYSKHVPPEATRYGKLSRFNEVAADLAPKSFQNLAQLSMGLLMTNLGRIPLPTEYGSLRLKELFFVPPSSVFVEIVLGVVTISDKLNISICYLEDVTDTRAVEEVERLAMEYLHAAIRP